MWRQCGRVVRACNLMFPGSSPPLTFLLTGFVLGSLKVTVQLLFCTLYVSNWSASCQLGFLNMFILSHNVVVSNLALKSVIGGEVSSVCTHTYVRNYVRKHIHTYIHAYIYIYIYIYTHTHIYIYTHTYIYTHIHSHIHVLSRKKLNSIQDAAYIKYLNIQWFPVTMYDCTFTRRSMPLEVWYNSSFEILKNIQPLQSWSSNVLKIWWLSPPFS